MEIIRTQACARAGLIGNPSDGYHGKTISIIVRDYQARVTLYEWEDLELMSSQQDQSRFGSLAELVDDVQRHGYYGGIRIVKATVRTFADYCARQGHKLHDRNFTLRYETNIPRQVGLSGSSAIVVAALRALMKFYRVDIPRDVLAALALSVETNELALPAGMQDRVIQVYEGMVFMDFAPERCEVKHGLRVGHYEPLATDWLPELYLAFHPDAVKAVQNDLRARFDRGDKQVHAGIARLAELAQLARKAIVAHDQAELSRLIDENFDIRASLTPIRPDHQRMIDLARSVGASAKFAGSGGAIIGVCADEAAFERLRETLQAAGCVVVKPRICV